MEPFTIRPIALTDRPALSAFIRSFWGSDQMVSRGRLHFTAEQDGFLAEQEGRYIGLLTYEIREDQMEITLLDSRERNHGVGTALIEAALDHARGRGVCRVWLITTNDNIRAIHFYQRRGFDMVALHYDAVRTSRMIKPEIPATGFAGIPIRHELEFGFELGLKTGGE